MSTKQERRSRLRKARRARARAAYAADTVEVLDPAIGGYTCLVATRRGLFAARHDGVKRIMRGFFFGITRHGPHLYLFEACDEPDATTHMGRIVRMDLVGDYLAAPLVLARGLDNQTHQIAVIDGLLCTVDTAHQAIARFTLAGEPVDVLRPVPSAPTSDGRHPYRHMNGLADCGEHIALMLHNGPVHPPEPSEIALLDRRWRLVRRYPLPGSHCHDILPLADGLWHCGSMAGEVISSAGVRIRVSDRMTRGLKAVAGGFVVGTSLFGPREDRERLSGSLLWLDHAFRPLAETHCPGAPTDILAL